MSDEQKSASGQPAAATTTTQVSLLDQAIEATKKTEPDEARGLIKALTEQALQGTVTWDKNITVTLQKAIQALDGVISSQLSEVMHAPELLSLEGTWRGLNHLVQNSETSTSLKIRMLNASKKDVQRDLSKALDFDQSELFKRLYEDEFGSAGGEPYGALIGDYEITNSAEDIDMLQSMAGLGAASLCPFITAASPAMFELDNWQEMAKVRDLAKGFQSSSYAKWRSFRDSEDSRYVNLVMPRVLARLPYGSATVKIDEFDFEEAGFDGSGNPTAMDHNDYCWMNASYVLGTNLTRAFAETGFCTAIRGLENGGKVENLPVHTFISDDGEQDMKCPTEIGITDRREKELGDLGFLPLLHYKNSDFAVFMGGQSVQRPKVFRTDVSKTEDYAISTRLPYIMAASRFGHYVKVMGRDKIGSFMEVEDCERWLNNWIKTYVNSSKDTGPELKARFPLRAAEVQVKPIPGKPGAYDAVLQMQPWLQMEELNASLQLVAEIPKKS